MLLGQQEQDLSFTAQAENSTWRMDSDRATSTLIFAQITMDISETASVGNSRYSIMQITVNDFKATQMHLIQHSLHRCVLKQ